MTATIAERAAKGAGELDAVWPEWFRLIDTDKLDMGKGTVTARVLIGDEYIEMLDCGCVISQLDAQSHARKLLNYPNDAGLALGEQVEVIGNYTTGIGSLFGCDDVNPGFELDEEIDTSADEDEDFDDEYDPEGSYAFYHTLTVAWLVEIDKRVAG